MRLDTAMVARNLIPSRNKAIELIKNAFVAVDGAIITKPSFAVCAESRIEILKNEIFVSRAGEKLAHYIRANGLVLGDMEVLDIGSSKGGFTQVLLQCGAKSVTCVDVGNNQLDTRLRENPRVIIYENCDVRDFVSDREFDFVVCDVSFISLRHIISALYRLAKSHALLLFKPQFEVGIHARRTKKGVVADKDSVKCALQRLCADLENGGFEILHTQDSALKGKEGNEEIFIYVKKR